VQTHDSHFGHIGRDFWLRNRFDNQGKQFRWRRCGRHQISYENSKLSRPGEFRTEPAVHKIRHVRLLVQKPKLVLNGMEPLQEMGAIGNLYGAS